MTNSENIMPVSWIYGNHDSLMQDSLDSFVVEKARQTLNTKFYEPEEYDPRSIQAVAETQARGFEMQAGNYIDLINK